MGSPYSLTIVHEQWLQLIAKCNWLGKVPYNVQVKNKGIAEYVFVLCFPSFE